MATPLPAKGDMDRSVSHGEETGLIVRGLASAPRPTNGLTGLPAALFRAIVHAMLGLDVDVHALESVELDVFAGALARRDRVLRPRLVQHMELLNLVIQPLDESAARRVETFAEEPCVGGRARPQVPRPGRGLVAARGARFRPQPISQPSRDRRPARRAPPAEQRSRRRPPGVDNAGRRRRRRRRLAFPEANCHQTRSVATSRDFYVLRGFAFPARRAPRHPAREHDWVHVLADYGTVEAEIEVFGFIARASDAPDVFALNVDELRRDLGVPPTSPGNDRGRQRPALASRRHETRPVGRGRGRVPTGTMSLARRRLAP